MIKGLYAAATGMMAIEAQQSVTANNIANAATPGFRRQQPVVEGFYQAFLKELGSPPRYNARSGPGGGVKLVGTFSDTKGGPIRSTGDPLNIALEGPGFIAVDTEAGERFTRNGRFTVNNDGQLATVDGHTVLSLGGGTIDVGEGPISITNDGTVMIGGQETGRIRVVEFENPQMLERQGDNLYFANEDVLNQSAEAAGTRIVHKAVEFSNVQIPAEMGTMMMASRAYAANQRVIEAFGTTIDSVIQRVGLPS